MGKRVVRWRDVHAGQCHEAGRGLAGQGCERGMLRKASVMRQRGAQVGQCCKVVGRPCGAVL